MKKFKIIFFICLAIMLSVFMYLNTTRDFTVKALDDVSKEVNVEETIKIDSAIKDLGMDSEEDVTTTILNKDNSISFNGTTLSTTNPKTTLNLKLVNSSLDNKVNNQVECFTSSSYINIYTDKDVYVIDEDSSIDIVINIELNHSKFLNNEIIDFSCKMVSSIM